MPLGLQVSPDNTPSFYGVEEFGAHDSNITLHEFQTRKQIELLYRELVDLRAGMQIRQAFKSNFTYKMRYVSKLFVKAFIMLILITCILYVIGTSKKNVPQVDENHRTFQDFCIAFTFTILLPNAYTSGVAVAYWLSKKSFDFQEKMRTTMNILRVAEESYDKQFSGFYGFLNGLLWFVGGVILSPLLICICIISLFVSCCYHEEEYERKMSNREFHHWLLDCESACLVFIGVVDVWQFLLLFPLAVIVIRQSENSTDALINTVAIQFLASLEDSFIQGFGESKRKEDYLNMVKQYTEHRVSQSHSRFSSTRTSMRFSCAGEEGSPDVENVRIIFFE